MNMLRERRSYIGPINIIVNNNNNNNNNNKKNNKSKGKNKNNNRNKRMSFRSFKDIKNNFLMSRKKSLNNPLFNKKKERSNSFTESGLFLKQFYSLMNNSKFFKNKHQILKEIHKKIASLKRNNSLKDLQTEIKLKNNSPFYKPNTQNRKSIEEKMSNESKTSEHNIHIIKHCSSKLNEWQDSIDKDNGGDVIHEYYGDKSSVNFLPNNDNTIFKKLNQKYQ